MSLDVHLTAHDLDGNEIEVYSANITHNLGKMAYAAGLYDALWRADERGWELARNIIPILDAGLEQLKADPAYFEKFNAPNDWGLYEHFVPFVEAYLEACRKYPSAVITVWR